MKAKLDFMSERQSVLAQNIANVDTPNYRAVDVSEPDFAKMAEAAGSAQGGKLRMNATHAGHMTGGSAAAAEYKIEKRKNTYELNPTANNVVVEEEMAKIAANQADYQKVLSLYAKTIGMFKTAIGRPTGGA